MAQQQLILDLTRIAAIRNHHSFTAPSLDNLASKLIMAIEEITEAHRLLREGRDLTTTSYQAQTGFWCKQHHRASCGVCWTRHDRADLWERYELSAPHGFAIELADAHMRLADIGYSLDIDVQTALIEKMDYNLQRPTGHGVKF